MWRTLLITFVDLLDAPVQNSSSWAAKAKGDKIRTSSKVHTKTIKKTGLLLAGLAAIALVAVAPSAASARDKDSPDFGYRTDGTKTKHISEAPRTSPANTSKKKTPKKK